MTHNINNNICCNTLGVGPFYLSNRINRINELFNHRWGRCDMRDSPPYKINCDHSPESTIPHLVPSVLSGCLWEASMDGCEMYNPIHWFGDITITCRNELMDILLNRKDARAVNLNACIAFITVYVPWWIHDKIRARAAKLLLKSNFKLDSYLLLL